MEDCLDRHKGGCQGEVQYRFALSGTGRSFPRCDRHWEMRLDEQDRINRKYAPFSDCPPAGVSYADWAGGDD